MAIELLLQVVYYTIMVVVASASVAKIVSRSVSMASSTVVESNVKVIADAMDRVSVERNHGHRLDTLERNHSTRLDILERAQKEMYAHLTAEVTELREDVSSGNARVEGRLDKLYELIVSRKGNNG